jgi:hypothetical protein
MAKKTWVNWERLSLVLVLVVATGPSAAAAQGAAVCTRKSALDAMERAERVTAPPAKSWCRRRSHFRQP